MCRNEKAPNAAFIGLGRRRTAGGRGGAHAMNREEHLLAATAASLSNRTE